MKKENQTPVRPLYEIAIEIKRDWKNLNKKFPCAQPYLDAMFSVNKISDNYYLDPASDIICYFLSNATTWKGENARRIKLELNLMLKSK